jgi:diguanylate cyclase (GGDEF)-like protein
MNSNDFLKSTLYTVGRVTVDKSLHTQSADEAFFRFFGNDVIYSIRRTVDENDFERLEKCISAATGGEIIRTAIRMKGINNELRWMLAAVRMLRQNDGEPLYSITISDIISLESLAYSREYRCSEYRHILSMTNDLAFEYSFETRRIKVYMFDCCREIVIVNEELDEWKRKSVELGCIPAQSMKNFDRLCSDIENGIYRFEHEFESSLLTYGKNREVNLFRGITRYDDPEHRKVTGLISSISSNTRAKNKNAAIESTRDSLSELLNKHTITSIIQDILNSAPNHNVNIILLDIDDFTLINNSYGHLFGDEVLYTVATIIKTEIGSRGFAGRLGGGNFLIAVEGTHDETDLRGILRAIRTKTECAFSGRFENFRLTCSMGISTYPVDSKNYDELFMQADKALYIAKEKGKNRYVIYDVNKHGEVEKDMDNKIVFLSSKKDGSEKLNFLGNLNESLVLGNYPDILVLLEQIRCIFGIDDVCVFAGGDMKLLLSCGNAESPDAQYIFKNCYTERFSG